MRAAGEGRLQATRATRSRSVRATRECTATSCRNNPQVPLRVADALKVSLRVHTWTSLSAGTEITLASEMMRRPDNGARAGRLVPAVLTALLGLAACRADSATTYDSSCTDQPGCASASIVEPNVLQALSDAASRILPALAPGAAAELGAPLTRLQAALSRSDMPGGRLALVMTYDAIDRAERTSPVSRPDLAVIRLSLVPAARALGLAIRESSVAATP